MDIIQARQKLSAILADAAGSAQKSGKIPIETLPEIALERPPKRGTWRLCLQFSVEAG
jgi:hypothetical protein